MQNSQKSKAKAVLAMELMNQLNNCQYDLKKMWFDAWGYEPHEVQEKIHRSTARFKVAICGRRFGKTLLASREIECRVTAPDQRVWVVAPNYSLTDKVFREVEDTFIRKDEKRAITHYSEYKKYMKFKNGSWVYGKSADNPDSLVGEGLDYLVIDEAAKVKFSVWEKYLRPTLTDRNGKVLFITTPEGMNWIYDLFIRGLDPTQPDWESFHAPSWANPTLPVKDIQEAKNTLTDEVFRQEYGAEFTTYAGQVYKNFDITTHVLDRVPKKSEFEEIIYGIDFGFENPTAILVIGIKDKCYYVIDEVYKTHMLDSDIVRELKRLSKKYPNGKRGYADHDKRILKSIGMKVDNIRIMKARKYKEKMPGIKTVSGLLKPSASGMRPRLFFDRRCKSLIKEMNLYRYGSETNKMGVNEDPLKKDDHAVDALRYAIHSNETSGQKRTLKGSNLP